MNSKTIAILAAAAVTLGAAALLLNRAPSSSTTSTTIPAALFPDLPAKVNDVASIEIKRPGEQFSLARTDAGWVLASKGNFPARLETVKATVVGVSRLKPVEAKTANPELYPRIGVQAPGDAPPAETPPAANPDEPPPTQPTLVTLKDASGATLASLIIGTQKWGGGGGGGVFVRKADDAQSWLAQGNLQVPTEPIEWIERQVLNIPRDRIKSVSVVHPGTGEEVEAFRNEPTDSAFAIANIPEGRELTAPTAPESLVTGVQYLNIDDVRPAVELGESAFANPDAVSVFRTFDGLVLTAYAVRKDDATWINIQATFQEPPAAPTPITPEADPATPERKAPDEVRKEAEELNTKLAPWAFAIPDYKARNFTATVETFLKPPSSPPAPQLPDAPEGPNPQ